MSKKKKGENVILIGFMGSGKTTMGIRLSYKLQIPVEDTDKIIESMEGMKTSEIFAEKGEAYFRKKETQLLESISASSSRKIYSLGGGTPMLPQNQGLICKCGKVIYLRAKAETIYERLKNDTSRPLLQCEDPAERIRSLLEMRDPIYMRCADFVVDVDECDQAEVLTKILEYLNTENNPTSEQ